MASSSSSTSRLTGFPLEDFYISLKQRINDLESMLQTDNNNFMSIQFIERVISVIRFCHDQKCSLPLRLQLPAGGTWFYTYMDDSEELKNATEVVKDCVEKMVFYNEACTYVTEFLDTNRVLDSKAVEQVIGAITDCTHEAEVLEEDNTPFSTDFDYLRQVEGVFDGCLGYNGVSYATRNVCQTLLRILMHGLVYCVKQYKFDKYVYRGPLFFDSSFMVSLEKLKMTVEAEIQKLPKRSGIHWYEFRNSKVILDKLLKEFERVLEGGADVDLESEGVINEIAQNLKQGAEVLNEGGQRIMSQIDDLTDEIIEGRKKVSGSA